MSAEAESKSTQAAGIWPEQIPEFLLIPPPQRLRVPIGGRGVGEAGVKPPGTVVQRGQPLVETAVESSHVPLAPVDGILGEVRPIRLTTGAAAVAVELIVTGQPQASWENLCPEENEMISLVDGLERIRSAGIWADRHASPDLIGQLNQVVSRPIDTLICTVLDTDAALRLGAAIAARHGDLIIAGINLLAKITGARRRILAVEAFAAPRWMMPLWHAARGSKLKVADLANEYPQSDPTLMLYSLTQRRLRPGNLPTSQGVLLVDAAAALAVGCGVCGEAMLSVPVAVHDHNRRHSHFLQAPVGTTVEHVLKHLNIPTDEVTVRGGDLLRDLVLRTDAVIAGGELAIHVTAPQPMIVPEPCIRCAWCIEACPTLIHPALILDAAQRRDNHMAERAGIAACIECGICSYVCPSRLPLMKAVRDLRNSKFD